jgi:hypothetical protein
MKQILTLTLLFFFLLGNAQDLLKGKFDSIKEYSSSHITLVYKKNKTAVYWQKTLVFKPSKNFYYFFIAEGILGEVDYETKEISYSVFDRNTGEYKKFINDEAFLEKRNTYGSPIFSEETDPLKIKQGSLAFRNSLSILNLEVFEDKISVIEIIDYSDPDKFDTVIAINSGIYDLGQNEWAIPSGIHSVQRFDNHLLVGNISDKKYYDVYELKDKQPLKKIRSITKESPEEYAHLLKADSLVLLEQTNMSFRTYNVYKDKKVGIIESNLFTDYEWVGELNQVITTEYDFAIPLVSSGNYLVRINGITTILTTHLDNPTILVADTSSILPVHVKRYTENYGSNFYYEDTDYANNSFRMDIISDSLLLIIDNELEEIYEVLDEYDEMMFDDEGEQIFEISLGTFKSGLFNSNTQKWIIPRKYYETYYLKGYIVAAEPQFRPQTEIRSRKYKYDIYNLNGKLLMSGVTEPSIEILQLFYPRSSITHLVDDEYQIERNGSSIWVEFSFTDGYPNYGSYIYRDNTEWVLKTKHQSSHKSKYLTHNNIIIESQANNSLSLSYYDNASKQSILIDNDFKADFYFENIQNPNNFNSQILNLKIKQTSDYKRWDTTYQKLNTVLKGVENSYFSLSKISDNLVAINDARLEYQEPLLDDDGIPEFDNDGYEIFQPSKAQYFSGILDLTTFEWVYLSDHGEIFIDSSGQVALVEYSIEPEGYVDTDKPAYIVTISLPYIILLDKLPNSNILDSYTEFPMQRQKND